VIWHKNYVRATPFEQIRMDAARKAGCILSALRTERGLEAPAGGRVELHHLIDGNRRMGHWHTIPLNDWYHSKVVPRRMTEAEAMARYGATIKHGSKAFLECHGLTDRDLWIEVQVRMGMDAEFPVSKILPRRIA
jgi:hypothetical protein